MDPFVTVMLCHAYKTTPTTPTQAKMAKIMDLVPRLAALQKKGNIMQNVLGEGPQK
jgi:hypothetical protein